MKAVGYVALAAALLALVASILERRERASMPAAALIRERFRDCSLHVVAEGAAVGSFAILIPFAMALLCGWVEVRASGIDASTFAIAGTATLVVKVVWAALEELIYRGALQPQLAKRIGGTSALFASAAIFALSHLERSGASAPSLLSLTVLALDGAGFGLAYAATRSLWLGTAWHATKNAWIWVLGGGTLNFVPGLVEARYTGPEVWVGGAAQAGLADLAATALAVACVAIIHRRALASGLAWTKSQ